MSFLHPPPYWEDVNCLSCFSHLPRRSPAKAGLSPGYGQLLADIKARVRAAQIRASLAANRELLALYWDIGRMILDRQKAEGWGTKVIDRLSRDLQNEFPGQQGFSPRNLKYMRAFAEAWPETVIVQQPGAQLPWKHHCLLLDQLDTARDRLWYAAKAVEHGWSRNVLALQIQSGLHSRQGKAVSSTPPPGTSAAPTPLPRKPTTITTTPPNSSRSSRPG